MALRWLDGFDAYDTAEGVAEALYGYTVASLPTLAGISTSSTGGAWRGSANGVMTTPVLTDTPHATWIMGIGVNRGDALATFVSGGGAYFGFNLDAEGEQFRFEIEPHVPGEAKPGNSYFKLKAMRGATVLANSNEFWELSTDRAAWIYFEFKVTIDNSAGAFSARYSTPNKRGPRDVTITWDAANTSVDTQNQTSTGADQVTCRPSLSTAGAGIGIDDWYVCDGSGSINNDFLGRVIVASQLPTGDGSTVDWTYAGGATNILTAWGDAASTDPNDARTFSEDSGDISLAAVGSSLGVIDSVDILGVNQIVIARMDTSGTANFYHMWRKTTGTPAQVQGVEQTVPDQSWRGFGDCRELDPNTAAAWVTADVQATQHGVERA